jgi:hypothetical protein
MMMTGGQLGEQDPEVAAQLQEVENYLELMQKKF